MLRGYNLELQNPYIGHNYIYRFYNNHKTIYPNKHKMEQNVNIGTSYIKQQI